MPSDRAEFDLRGGSEKLLKFVCAFVMLLRLKKGAERALILWAYAISHEVPEDTVGLDDLAERAWDRSCVQKLLDRIWHADRTRDVRTLHARALALAESAVENAFFLPPDEQAKILNASVNMLKYEQTEEKIIDKQREKLGLDEAVMHIGTAQKLDDLNDAQLESFIKVLHLARERRQQKALE